MFEKNLAQRLGLIGVVVVIAILALFDFRDRKLNLRPGLDIAGGVSMIFEIDDEGMQDNPNLAEEMKTLLQKRVDPHGVYDLKWRVHGRNRIEVQMPLPPKDAKRLQEEYLKAEEELFSTNLKLSAVETAVRMPVAQRADEIRRLAAGAAEREQLLTAAARAYDTYDAAQVDLRRARAGEAVKPLELPDEIASAPATASGPTPQQLEALEAARRDAQEAYEDALGAVLAGNLDATRFKDILEMEDTSAIRRNSLAELEGRHPQIKDKIAAVLEKHRTWRQSRGALDGPADLQRLLRGAGVLEFRILAEPNPDNMTKFDRYRRQLLEIGPRPRPGDEEGWFKIDNPLAFFYLNSPAELAAMDYKNHRSFVVEKRGDTFYVLGRLGQEFGLLHGQNWQLKRAMIDRDQQGRLCVQFQLDQSGGGLFEDLTRQNLQKQLCILLDGTAYSAAVIQSKISTHGQITGDFSLEKVSYLVQTMQAGALPARLKETPLSERTIGSSLGEANLNKALYSGYIAGCAVIAIMIGYYFLCGSVAVAALALNVLLTLAILAMLDARMTLDGIAGIILSIGMTVDANVLIYERMREEKQRGSSLRLIVKNGFDKAFSTIFDSNITTLLICVIIYYVGSEEIKGFGLTLGWGIVLNLFTSVFVSRTLFSLLLKYNVLKDVKMMHLIPPPTIDWYGKRKMFLAISTVVIASGLALTWFRGKDLLDVEFRGGVNAELELKQRGLNDIDIARKITDASAGLKSDAAKLASATVEPGDGPSTFIVSIPGVDQKRIAAFIIEPLEDASLLQRGGLDMRAGEDRVRIRAKESATAEQLQNLIRGLTAAGAGAADNIARSAVGSVVDLGNDAEKGLIWNITTIETNKRLVQNAIETAVGQDLRIQPRITYVFRGQEGRPVPITDSRLENVLSGLPPEFSADVTDFREGAALWFDDMSPPQSVQTVKTRLKNMRLQPGYQDYPYRPFEILGVKPAGGKDESGQPLYSSMVVVLSDASYRYSEDADRWLSEFAGKEQTLAMATLDSEQTLRKVSQFKPQIAAQSQTRASLALLLSWAMIIGYVWIRFGRPSYGIAGVIALVHDVLVALGCVALSGVIGGGGAFGSVLLIDDFKISMPIIAAFLTIIGFSINDTIVIFDRIRELRGRLGVVTPRIINDAVNQCMARTLLTSFTVLVVLLAMYIFGGSSIRGFNYAMFLGSISGVYSTVAIAAPILLFGAKDVQEE
ncbi:bifunctional preprotein translocase subunit SecD/SecF [Phycisphaerae bacterium RAS1]|nr:bifunctional preprotein translocase subunit SecD/SecF [Phycisphaerae bacterium RAS1]